MFICYELQTDKPREAQRHEIVLCQGRLEIMTITNPIQDIEYHAERTVALETHMLYKM